MKTWKLEFKSLGVGELPMKHDGHWTIFTTDFGAKLDTRIAFFSPFE
jgi:hypothetical protein